MTETERELDFLVAELREENGILRRALEEALRPPKLEETQSER